MEEALLEYISVCKDRGLEDDEITANLIETGWKEEDILKAIKKIEKEDFPRAPVSPERKQMLEKNAGLKLMHALYIIKTSSKLWLIVSVSLFINNSLDRLQGIETFLNGDVQFWTLLILTFAGYIIYFVLSLLIKRKEFNNSILLENKLRNTLKKIEVAMVALIFVFCGIYMIFNNIVDFTNVMKLIYLLTLLWIIKKTNE